MESIGKHLRQCREQRGLNIDQIARETNISRHYLVALEEDRYDVFPAEPYVIGFLRNYGDHLGLDTEDLINKYRTLKIQEQPAPLEELIRKPRAPLPLGYVWLGAGVIGVLLVGFLVLPPLFGFLANLPRALTSAGPDHQPRVYTLTAKDKNLDQRLYTGDAIAVEVGGQTVSLPLTSIADETALGDYKFHLGDELFIDVNGDGVQDLRVLLKDVTPTDVNRGAEFAVERMTATTGNLATGPLSVGDEMKPGLAAAGSSSGAVEGKPIVILQDVPSKPFTVDVVFRGYALFRYVVDDNRREENFFHKGDTVRIDASRKIKLWISDAGAFSGKVNQSNDFEIGHAGEVVARSIEWAKDNAGKVILVANPMN